MPGQRLHRRRAEPRAMAIEHACAPAPAAIIRGKAPFPAGAEILLALYPTSVMAGDDSKSWGSRKRIFSHKQGQCEQGGGERQYALPRCS